VTRVFYNCRTLTHIQYKAGITAISVMAGDFNNDTKLDLVVVNAGSNDLFVFLNECR